MAVTVAENHPDVLRWFHALASHNNPLGLEHFKSILEQKGVKTCVRYLP